MTSALPRRALALTCVVGLGSLGLAAAAGTASAAPGGHVTLTNTVPRWLGHAQKQQVAAAAAASQSVRVYLAPRGGLDALKAEVASLSDPASAQYKHWLTSAQYDAAYAPTAATADAVASYLRSQGLTVSGVEAHRRYVSASGTRAQLGAAFGTSLATYRHDGQTVTANASAVALPAAIGASVLTVTGLDTTVQKKTPNHVVPGATGDAPATTASVSPNAKPPAGFQNGRPCAINFGTPLALYKADYKTPLPQFRGQTLPYAPCGYTGPSFRAAYEGATSLTGAGVTVAITDAYAWQYIAQDAQAYATQHGDGGYARGQFTQSRPAGGYTNGRACGPSGWSGEETLDVEAVHAMAPAANIRYYASASCLDSDFLETLGRVVDEGKATIVTNSWSDLESNESAASVAAYEQVFLQGATQGVTFLFSSGDNGDELAKTGIKQVDYPASDPYATAAGGTATGIAGGQVVAQTGWGTHSASLSADGSSWVDTGFLYGAGGGNSALFNQPSFQSGVVPTSPAGRGVPDIAMDADPNTGMLVGQTQTFPDGIHYGEYRIGGTSLASPLLAGMMALANESAGAGLGWANPLLYSAPKSTITDVTHNTANGVKGVVRANNVNGIDPSAGVSYFVRTFDQDSSLATGQGWDPVTGLGVPNAGFLAAVAAKK